MRNIAKTTGCQAYLGFLLLITFKPILCNAKQGKFFNQWCRIQRERLQIRKEAQRKLVEKVSSAKKQYVTRCEQTTSTPFQTHAKAEWLTRSNLVSC